MALKVFRRLKLLWNVNYDINYTVISVLLPNGTFADKLGNSIYFDGWSIQSIVGLQILWRIKFQRRYWSFG